MSFRSAVADLRDRTHYQVWKYARKEQCSKIGLTPVFHVEQLYVDEYFDRILNFLIEYKNLTACRAVLTCMTPLSPILARSLEEAFFSAEKYWARIEKLKEYSLIGLHGHYVRVRPDRSFCPSHFAFHDIDAIERQLNAELDALISADLVSEDLLIYSAGWWFTSDRLRELLSKYGFLWDYSISPSIFNTSPGSSELEIRRNGGRGFYLTEGGRISTAPAVCSISGKNRPLVSFSKIASEFQRQSRDGDGVELSLYSHDYDLDLRSALEAIQSYKELGMRFVEPS